MNDVIRFVLVVALMLAVGGFLFFIIPIAQRLARGPARLEDEEVAVLRNEVESLRHLPGRVAELEERLDFAERLLAQQDPGRLHGGRDA